MDTIEFIKCMNEGKEVVAGSELHQHMVLLSNEAMKTTSKINNGYLPPQKILELMEELTGSKIEDFTLFPPFYTDCGKNIKIGKGVFVNSCCHFQDQGGITIGDNCLIGHNVVLATLNHPLSPDRRANVLPKAIVIGKNVWIGSKATILSGVEIGDNSVVAAGAVVSKSVPAGVVVGGVPAKIIRVIE